MTPSPETVERVALALVNYESRKMDLPELKTVEEFRFVGDRDEYLKLATAALAAAWEWKDPAIELPKKPGKESYEYVDCLIIKKNGDVLFRPWNCEHKVFDDEDYDDFYCNAEDVKLWCEIVRPPRPADVKGEVG